MADVGHLVGQDALELIARELGAQAAGDGDRGVLRVAPGGEGVEGGVVDEKDSGHRHARGDGKLFDHIEKLWVVRNFSMGLAPDIERMAEAPPYQLHIVPMRPKTKAATAPKIADGISCAAAPRLP